jgi:hypothetical protein
MTPTLEERITLATIRSLASPEFEACSMCGVMVIYGRTDGGYVRLCGCTLKSDNAPATERTAR